MSAHPTRPSRARATGPDAQAALPQVAGYEVIQLLGRGGMGSVYLARQRMLDRLVALKELSPPFAGDPEFNARFLRESRLAGGLAHPNVVTVFDYFEHRGLPYIAMEHVARGSLREFMTRRRSLAEVCGVLEGVFAALTHAHAAGVVHCDVKPENVLVTADGAVKLGDFGVARAAGLAAAASGIGRPTGTLAYMAPEVAARGRVDHRADLWSVGVLAHELLAGSLPERFPVRLPDADATLAGWLSRLLEPEPERRHQSAEEAWDHLEGIALTALGGRWRRQARLGAGTVTLGVERSTATSRRPRRLLASALGLASAAGALAVWLPEPPPAPAQPAVDRRDARPLPYRVAAARPPVRLEVPTIVRATSQGGAVPVTFQTSARRAGRRITVRCSRRSGTAFPIGSTRVRCQAGDAVRWFRVSVARVTAPGGPGSGGRSAPQTGGTRSDSPGPGRPQAPTQGIAVS